MLSEPTWVPVAPADDVSGPPWPCHDVAGVPVRLVRDADGRILAIGPSCPHLGAPLSRARVEDGQVWCRRHWYGYDTTTGANLVPGWDLRLPVYACRVVDGTVEVDVSGPRGPHGPEVSA